jgi:hypothetical protein
MKTKQDGTERDPAKQMKKFEQQPPQNKELELMEDHAEKSTGPERVESNRKIRSKAARTGNGG